MPSCRRTSKNRCLQSCICSLVLHYTAWFLYFTLLLKRYAFERFFPVGNRDVRFIAALAPAITFGSRFLDGTNGQFGVLEMIMSTSISGLIFSTFAGQPLSILGATGPFLAYTLVVYDLAIAVDIEFMPLYFWTCMWCSVFTILVAVFDLCALMKHVTMFSEDISRNTKPDTPSNPEP